MKSFYIILPIIAMCIAASTNVTDLDPSHASMPVVKQSKVEPAIIINPVVTNVISLVSPKGCVAGEWRIDKTVDMLCWKPAYRGTDFDVIMTDETNCDIQVFPTNNLEFFRVNNN